MPERVAFKKFRVGSAYYTVIWFVLFDGKRVGRIEGALLRTGPNHNTTKRRWTVSLNNDKIRRPDLGRLTDAKDLARRLLVGPNAL